MKDHRAEVVEVEIFPHDNADRLEIARPIGSDWHVIVGKGDFKTGDLGVYIPIDSIVPDVFVQKYLSGSKIKLEKNRIRSAKIRGVISQGLLVPAEPGYQLGQDVTDELGIIKYEPPERLTFGGGNKEKLPKKEKPFRRYINSLFPEYTKIQNHKNNINVIPEGTEVVITEKIHGSNHRSGSIYVGGFKRPWYIKLWNKICFKKPERWHFTVGSHHVVKWYEDQLYHRAARESGIDKLDHNWNGLIFYGEVAGPGIQELMYGIPPGQIRLFIFDIIYMNMYGQYHYLPWDEVVELCELAGLETVPVIYRGPWSNDLVKLADGKTLVSGAKHHREGFVVKPVSELWSPKIGRMILKRVSDTYLLGKHRTDFH